jgi:LysR family transcriptional regulator, glycine cleavage system transcriptional activator
MPRRLPPLNSLRAFEAAARLGSFTAASRELRVTASAISQQVLVLERFLGARLFKRLPRGLVLTATGRTYLPELTAGLDGLAEATRRLRSGDVGGLLCVTTLPAFATGWLLPRLHRFRERYPRIELVLRTDRAVLDFRKEDLDLAIRFTARATTGDLRAVALLDEELFPVASPALVSPARLPLQLADLAELPLLHDTDASPNQPWMGWRDWFEREGLDVSVALRGMRFSDSSVMIGAAIAGLGVAIGRSPHIEGHLARGQLVRLTTSSWKAEWSYHLVGPAASFARPNVKAFVGWALEEAAPPAPGLR